MRGTKTKGLIIKPDKNKLQLNLYVDADFASIFTSEDRDDPISVKSRTGLLLTFGDVPIFGVLSYNQRFPSPQLKQST